jgi:uncharacterized protein RhaS with RHS repeats
LLYDFHGPWRYNRRDASDSDASNLRIEMKRHILYLLCTVATLVSTVNAVAFYNPSTGRWLSRDPIEEKGGNNLYAALLNSPLIQVDSDGRMLFGLSQIRSIIAATAMLAYQARAGMPILAPVTQWLNETRRIAAAGIQASMGSSASGAGGAAGGIGKPPKNFYKYAGTGWALALVSTSLMATYSTVYASCNLALGQRSSEDSYMYSVESGLINASRGETAYGDLDFIDAALMMTGGVGSTALVALDTFVEGADVFAQAFTEPNE